MQNHTFLQDFCSKICICKKKKIPLRKNQENLCFCFIFNSKIIMKKLFTFLFALAAFNLSTHAELKFHESFNRTVGTDLRSDDFVENTTTDVNNWYTYSGTSGYIQVVAGNLTFDGYASEGVGNSVKLLSGFIADDLRLFSPVSNTAGNKVYAGALINVSELKNSTSYDYFLTLGDATFANTFARLYVKSVKDAQEKYIGFQMGITKNNETSSISWADGTFSTNTTYLVVLEYEFVSGDKNDIARLYINPTSATTTASAVSSSTVTTQADAANIQSFRLRQGSNTPAGVIVDEIKVATTWAELFETSAGGGEEPTPAEPVIVVDEVVTIMDPSFSCTFTGETYTKTLTVMAENLTEDIALTSSSAELTLSTTTIAKDDADLAEGKEITLTLTPTTASPEEGSSATITLASGTLTETVTVNWAAMALTRCTDVATLKAAGAAGEVWDVLAKFTGEAVVTFIESNMEEGTTFFTIEDATGAVNIDAPHWMGVTLGDKVSNILTLNGEMAWGIQPFMAMDSKVTIVSRDNKVTPQEVTLAELKANAAAYLLELVVVKGVMLDRPAENFAQGNCKITQGEVTANINLLAGNPLIGTTKPAAANVTGISSSTSGTVIRPRTAEDIEPVDVGAGIEAVETEESMEVYTLMGQRVSSLQPGVNIIRKGNTTYKVIR